MTLPQYLFGVQFVSEVDARVAATAAILPIETGPTADLDSFEPTEADLAWDRAYCLTRDGERPFAPKDPAPGVFTAHFAGAQAGRIARETAEARELGHALGLTSGICEPPAGFAPHEAEAYRAGFFAGQGEADEDLAFHVWVAEQEADRMELAFGEPGIREINIYPAGCVS